MATTTATATFGGSGYAAAPGDYDGDGLADPAIYQTTTGEWIAKLSAFDYGTASGSLGGTGWSPVQ